MPDEERKIDMTRFHNKRKEIEAARASLLEVKKTEGTKSMKYWDAQEALIALEAQHNDMVLQLHPREQERYLASIREKRA